jgi:hypothetical protein
MIADLAGEVGIIVFCNTSLGGAEQRFLAEIQDAVWTRAEELRKSTAPD